MAKRASEPWAEETAALKRILGELPLVEERKWGKPCYTFEGRNVAIIIPLKESCALAFCQGALLKDPKGILLRPGENTQGGRWVKFTSVAEIAKRRTVLKAYLKEAIAAEKAGKKVQYKAHSEYKRPAELLTKFKEVPALEAAFDALTPGRQRAYILHFSAPKQSATRLARIDKCRPLILAGKGLLDDYLQRRKSGKG